MAHQLFGKTPESLDEQIKQWVVMKAAVTRPPSKEFVDGFYYSASVTIGGYNINGIGDTIERAYIALTNMIATSAHYRELFKRINSK